MSKKIAGVLPIVHTPFNDDNTIDYVSLTRLIDWIFELKCDGFGVAMASEVLRLTADERIELTIRLAEINKNRGIFFVNVGAESSKQAILFAKAAEKAGCDAIMSIPPISQALPKNQLDFYFRNLAETIDLPLIIQDASGYVGKPMAVEFMAEFFLKYGPQKILFKPEAAPIGPILSALRDATDGKAKIFEGSGGIMLVDSYRRGISGTMPGCDLLDGIVQLWQALKNNDDEQIYRLYFPICAIIALELQAGLDGFIAIEKYLMVKRKIFSSDRRREPYSWSLDDETRKEIDRLFECFSRIIN